MPTVVIADDHLVLREGVKSVLRAIEDLEVVAEATNGLELASLVEKHCPDLVIVDLSMPTLGGIEAIVRIQKLPHKPCILVLSAREDDLAVNEAVEAGARGYVPKTSASDELIFAVRAVLKGQTYISPSVAGALINRSDGMHSPLQGLTDREREVMKLLCEGHPNRKVAKTLHISARTVDSHRANIMKKLAVSS
ncbi:MAG TPA: response regulator transcription factor, partial [Oligoflexia bacterium]|nr:response regulator transcription factor [Oligoflexia bacterium]